MVNAPVGRLKLFVLFCLPRFLPFSLFLSSWRFFFKHPWQFWLTLLSIALGSAVMIAVDLANNSARESFSESVQIIGGRATHKIIMIPGPLQRQSHNNNINEKLFTLLRTQWGFRNSAPIVEGDLVVQGEQYRLLGTDILAASRFVAPTGQFSSSVFTTLLTKANSAIVSRNTAERLQMHLNQPFTVSINGRPVSIIPVAYFPDQQNTVLDSLFLTDISSAQELLGKTGLLDRIDLLLDQDEASRLASDLKNAQNKGLVSQNLKLLAIQNKKDALQQMTAAFRTNLTAMSLLAMLVGAFLVYNTMTFSVLQRRNQFAIERMLGVTGLQIFIHILLEALFLGLLGSIIGVMLGVILGQGLLVLITRTLNDLYSAVDLSVLLLQPLLIIKGIGIALLAALLATLAPAWEAAKVAPIIVNRSSGLEQHFHRVTPWLFVSGITLIALSGLLLATFERSLTAGFVALFMLVIGYSLWVPLLITLWVSILLRPIKIISGNKTNLLWSMAIRGIQTSLSRTNLAIIALAIAVSATVGVGIMITSFRTTVSDWLQATLQSDLYISVKTSNRSSETARLDEFWPEEVRKLSGVKSVSTGTRLTMDVEGVPTPVFVLDPGRHGKQGFRLLKGDIKTAWKRYMAGEAVLVSEPFAYHHQLKPGDHFQADITNNHHVNFEIAAVYQDYSATQGMVLVPPALYHTYWKDHSITSLGLLLEKGVALDAMRKKLVPLAIRSSVPVRIRSNKDVRELSLEVFDRTFAITNVLRLLVILVAFVGVFSALMALFLEKRREYSILRATGLTPGQLTRMVLLQTIVIGFLAGLLALPLGWAMSEILILVINQRSFGWTMSRSFPPMIIVQALLLSTSAALLAGLYPVHRIARISISRGLR